MACTVYVTITTAASGGANPIYGSVSWTGEQGGLGGPVNITNQGNTPVTINPSNGNTVQMTAHSPGYNDSASHTIACGASWMFELTQPGDGGGSSGGGPSAGQGSGGCFIASAAYGTESAPEVKFLQEFRDNVLRRTRWGMQFFDNFWKYYYRISPAIAEEMNRDPEARRLIGWAIVEPWLNYIKAMMRRPDFKSMKLEALDPTLREFLEQLQRDYDRWIRGVELPASFKGREPGEAIHELNIILGLLLLRTDGKAYLEDLTRRGELPLQYAKEGKPKLQAALKDAGRTQDEIEAILGVS